jgi:hypothetical protein
MQPEYQPKKRESQNMQEIGILIKGKKPYSSKGFVGGHVCAYILCHYSFHCTISTSLSSSEAAGIRVKPMHHPWTLMEHVVILTHKGIPNLHAPNSALSSAILYLSRT